MKKRKYVIICSLFAILTVPILFGLNFEYFTIRELNWLVIIIAISGLFMLLILGKIVEIFGYNRKIVETMRKNDVINALINGDSNFILWFLFPIIIMTEELIFRYYTIGILFYILGLESIVVIFISSLFFSLFHIHIWFRYKNLRILLINLGYPFLLGLYIGYIFLKFGIIPCIIIHYVIAFYSYYNIYRRYFRNND